MRMFEYNHDNMNFEIVPERFRLEGINLYDAPAASLEPIIEEHFEVWSLSKGRKVVSTQSMHERYEANKFKIRVSMKLCYAVNSGKITRPDRCSQCGSTCKPHGHHEDYSKPFEVMWLCAPCHRALHKKRYKDAVPASHLSESAKGEAAKATG